VRGAPGVANPLQPLARSGVIRSRPRPGEPRGERSLSAAWLASEEEALFPPALEPIRDLVEHPEASGELLASPGDIPEINPRHCNSSRRPDPAYTAVL
jgi:hypothetical protein